jgi:hypothetical protein
MALIPLVLVVVIAGLLLAIFLPRNSEEPSERTPVLITTQTIPPAEP